MRHIRMRKLEKNKWKAVVGVLGCLVLFLTVYNLILPALTLEKETYCGNPEHTHTLACYSNPKADVETPADWEATLPKRTKDIQKNTVEIAKSQIGYRESDENYAVEGEDVKKGYTRYGQWSGNPYGDWNVYFTNFVLHYAGTNIKPFESTSSMVKSLKAANRYVKPDPSVISEGNLAFLKTDGKTLVGIVTKAGGSGRISVVLGDVQDRVKKESVSIKDTSLLGIGLIQDKGRNSRSAVPFSLGAGELDMTPMITHVSMEQKNGIEWFPIQQNAVVSSSDSVRFILQYTVPGQALTDTKRTLCYQAPGIFKNIRRDNGVVYNTENQQVGTYQIESNGKVSITFNEAYVTKNMQNQPIEGSIVVEAKVNTTGLKDGDNINIPFTPDLEYILVAKVNPAPVEDTGDISLTKSAEKLVSENLIKFTVIVSTEQGTFDVINMKDIGKNMDFDRSKGIQVTNKKGEPVQVKIEESNSHSASYWELPQMDPGEVYTIVYYASPYFDDMGNKVSNEAWATSTSRNGTKISAHAKSVVDYNILSKASKHFEDNDTFEYTLTINQDRIDISFWKVEDVIQGGVITGDVTLIDSNGKSEIITFPYVFPKGSTDTYIVKYHVKPVRNKVGDQVIKNTAYLSVGLHDLIITQDSTENKIGRYDPIKKTVVGEPTVENGVVVVTWKVTIESLKGINGTLEFKDLLSDQLGQFMTKEQYDDAKKNIEEELKKNGVRILSWKDYTQYDNRGFSFKFDTDTLNEKPITFTYQTSATPRPGVMKLENTASLSDRTMAVAATDFEKQCLTISKRDLHSNGEPETRHYLHDLPGRQLAWIVDVSTPSSKYDLPLVITEELPEGVHVTAMKLNAPKHSSDIKATIGDAESGDFKVPFKSGGKNHYLDVNVNKNKFVIVVPPSLHAKFSGSYSLEVNCNITDKQVWQDEKDKYEHSTVIPNKVSAMSGNDESGKVSAQQTQKILKNDLYGTLKKDGRVLGNNVAEFNIVINPNKTDLDPISDTIKIEDTIEYHTQNGNNAELVPNSVKAVTASGESFIPKYTYEKKSVGVKNYHTLYMELPDSEAITVTYQYKVSGIEGMVSGITNIVKLIGFSGPGSSAKNVVTVTVHNSAAHATVKGITIYKTDEKNQGLYLPGAEYAIYQYSNDSKDYVKVTDKDGNDKFVTDENGRLTLSMENVTDFSYNTAYKIVETKAPTNYIKDTEPYYFYMEHSDTDRYPAQMPQDFKGEKQKDGNLVFFQNEKQKQDLKILKNWFDEDGTIQKDVTNKAVTVKLYQSKDGGKKTLYGTYTLKAEDGWKVIIPDVPQYEMHSDGTQGAKYIYTVEEDPVTGYKAEYDNSLVNEGKITISNKKRPGFLLPNTGGPGVFPIVKGGMILMLVSVLALSFRRIARK